MCTTWAKESYGADFNGEFPPPFQNEQFVVHCYAIALSGYPMCNLLVWYLIKFRDVRYVCRYSAQEFDLHPAASHGGFAIVVKFGGGFIDCGIWGTAEAMNYCIGSAIFWLVSFPIHLSDLIM